jgi:hypothetical protein
MSMETSNMAHEAAPQDRGKNDWREKVNRISYNTIVKNLGYITFLAVLGIIYIGNSRQSIDIQRAYDAKSKLLEEKRWQYIDTKSKLIQAKNESRVINASRSIGLKPSALPAYKIVARTQQKTKETK